MKKNFRGLRMFKSIRTPKEQIGMIYLFILKKTNTTLGTAP